MHDSHTLICDVRIGKWDLLEVWHNDPKGDQGPPCGKRKYWQWHIHHISKVTVPFVRQWWRKRFLKCAWCGGSWTKTNPVNLSTQAYGGAGRETVHFKGHCYRSYVDERFRLHELRRTNSANI